MAYAGDLKSPVPYGTCGFDPHPGYHNFVFGYLPCQFSANANSA